MVNTLYLIVSIVLWLALPAVSSAAADLRYIALAPSEVCSGIEYTNPVDMVTYQGQKNCLAPEDVSCSGGESGEACMVLGDLRAVAQNAIDPTKILEGRVIGGVQGIYSDALVNPTCTASQRLGCRTTSLYVAIDTTQLPPKLKAGEVFAGVTGTYSDPLLDCSVSKTTGCKVAAGFVAVLKESLVPQNIKNGETIAGVAGIYPSDTAQLDTTQPALKDLTSSNFAELVRSTAQSFNFFDHTGKQYTRTGDAQLLPANIRAGTEIFALIGTLTPAPRYEDVRKNAGLYSGKGKLKLDCRNAFADSYQNNNSYPSVDDGNNTVKLTNFGTYPLWTKDNLCDQELWLNATKDSNGAIVSCTNEKDHCVYRDTVTKLNWLNDSSKTPRNKSDAQGYCAEVVVNGDKGWRLPTHKELLQAYVHRLRYVSTSSNFLDPNVYYWSSSSRPDTDSSKNYSNVALKPANGESAYGSDDSQSFNVLCVK